MWTIKKLIGSVFWTTKERGSPANCALELDISGFDTIYAIGDAHGCYGQVRRLEALILEDIALTNVAAPAILYLGDVIDRGQKSAHLLDHLTSRHSDTVPRHCLRGNHEQFFLDFWKDPKGNVEWLEFGGAETLASYGIYETQAFFKKNSLASIGSLLKSSIPETHVKYMADLPHFARTANFLFCHAGIDPTKSMSEQTAEDYMWARDRFLAHEDGYGFRVVHGHTPVCEAGEAFGRISIDTGAYQTGSLSCARIDIKSSGVSFISSI